MDVKVTRKTGVGEKDGYRSEGMSLGRAGTDWTGSACAPQYKVWLL